MKYNGIPTPCEAISYGEVSAVNIVAGAADTTAPAAPSSLAASGTTTTTNLSWSASSDNVAVTGYSVYQEVHLKATVASTSYVVTGLTANNAYIL
jgi:chitodextrinase